MNVRLLFLASLKDIVGARELRFDLPTDATVGDLLSKLEVSYPRLKDYRQVVLTAINEEYVAKTARIADGDEVAIFPPVSGGEVETAAGIISREGEYYQSTREPIDAQDISRSALGDADNAICPFEGVVRDHSKGN